MLPNIPDFTCAESFGQIQKVAFQRLYKSTGEKNSFTTLASIRKKTSWVSLLSAGDDTKVVVSPYIQAPTAEAGAPRTFGGGNETLGGIEEIIGREPTTFTAVMRKMPQSLIKALKDLQCESDSQNLGVYLFDENGAIGALQDPTTTTTTTHYPIPIRSLFIGDKTLGGFEAPDSNAIQWAFLPNWSDDLAIIVPEDFNPLTDLKNQQGKQTIVTLENETSKTARDFEVSHAERLLKMPNNGGWQLPENSKFEFDKENGLRYKRNKKADNGATEQSGDK